MWPSKHHINKRLNAQMNLPERDKKNIFLKIVFYRKLSLLNIFWRPILKKIRLHRTFYCSIYKKLTAHHSHCARDINQASFIFYYNYSFISLETIFFIRRMYSLTFFVSRARGLFLCCCVCVAFVCVLRVCGGVFLSRSQNSISKITVMIIKMKL